MGETRGEVFADPVGVVCPETSMSTSMSDSVEEEERDRGNWRSSGIEEWAGREGSVALLERRGG